jgi:redox-sensitive bicupin YhaK (pirin superfamily)
MNWGRLRVWNDDAIAPGTGFDPHGHRDMEIVTFVREGAITHRDNLGNEGRTEAGDVQIMSAGTGIVHAEYNLEQVTTRIFQIWIVPDRTGGAPRWGSRVFPKGGRAAGFEILASGRQADAGAEALPINADAAVLAATLAPVARDAIRDKQESRRTWASPGRPPSAKKLPFSPQASRQVKSSQVKCEGSRMSFAKSRAAGPVRSQQRWMAVTVSF